MLDLIHLLGTHTVFDAKDRYNSFSILKCCRCTHSFSNCVQSIYLIIRSVYYWIEFVLLCCCSSETIYTHVFSLWFEII